MLDDVYIISPSVQQSYEQIADPTPGLQVYTDVWIFRPDCVKVRDRARTEIYLCNEVLAVLKSPSSLGHRGRRYRGACFAPENAQYFETAKKRS